MAGYMNTRFERLLVRFPSLRSRLTVRGDPQAAFARVLRLFKRAGFYIAAEDSGLLRFCGYRRGRQYNCTCMHVIWVTTDQGLAHVNYGIEPRHRFSLSCSCQDIVAKLDQCDRAVRKAVDEVEAINGLAFDIVNGGRPRRLIARGASSLPTYNDHFGINSPFL